MEVILAIGFIIQHWQACLIVAVLIFVFLCIYSSSHAKESEARQRAQYYFEQSDKLVSVYQSKSIKKVKEAINKIDFAYNNVQDGASSHLDYLYTDDRKSMVEHLHDLEQAKWERKANVYLQDFLDCYTLIVSHELENFHDVELLFKTKKRCIEKWQRYFAIDLTEYETTIYPKRYLREWLGDDYDPCMESHDALERMLSSHVDAMRPEFKRKKALYDIIVNYVASHNTIAKAELLKVHFDGYIADEVKCCYRALIKENRLVEVKLGNRYFVSLSDKEAAITPRKDRKEEQKVIPRSDKLVHDAIVKHLMDEGAEYIDMTHKGGGLYFFSESIAEDLKAKGYNIGYAENGSKSTSGKPAWYLRQ